MKSKSKNLIVIIGNGFDLAHGLPTSYNSFAEYYLEEKIVENLINGNKENIISPSFYSNYENNVRYPDFYNTSATDERQLQDLSVLIRLKKKEEIISFIKTNTQLYNILHNNLLSKLYSNSYENWFDIEQAYYEELKKIYKLDKNKRTKVLLKLNSDLSEIKKTLKEYLSLKIKPKQHGNIHYSFEQHFIERQNISFVNFNYTNTINCYSSLQKVPELSRVNFKNIYIHNNLEGDIVFGYGDDTDSIYQEMKMTKNNEFLRYFKTFDYLKSTNYTKVLNEIARFKIGYDVLIIGHSLGMTDKTILKTILDSEACHHIELLKRSDLETEEEKQEHLFELHANLARIFDSEGSLREKVIPFESSVNFPEMYPGDTEKLLQRVGEVYPKIYK